MEEKMIEQGVAMPYPYCGQYDFTADFSDCKTKEESLDLAIQNCGCVGSGMERARKMKIEQALASVGEIFEYPLAESGYMAINDGIVIDMINDLIVAVGRGHIKRAVIDLPDGSATISRGGDALKIERKLVKKQGIVVADEE